MTSHPPTERALPAEGGTVLHCGVGADYKVDGNGCWIWQRSIDPKGYGRVTGRYPERRAHRLYYRIAKGVIPEGAHVHHRCHVRLCVNPDHLEAISARDHLVNHGRRDFSHLTPEVIREIRAQVAGAQKTYAQLAAEFDCSFSTVGYIARGERWLDDGEVVPEARTCRRCGGPVSGHRGRRFCGPACQKNFARKD